MKITKRQLRRIIKEEKARLRTRNIINEGAWDTFKEIAKDVVDPSGWLVSGAGMGVDEQTIEKTATPDAWKLFKALGGAGTDESTVKDILNKRSGDLDKLNKEFDDLKNNLGSQRGEASTYIIQGLFGGVGNVGINAVMSKMQKKDLTGWLESDGMKKEAEILKQSLEGGSVKENKDRKPRMKITKRQLRRIIKEETARFNGMGPRSNVERTIGLYFHRDKLANLSALVDEIYENAWDAAADDLGPDEEIDTMIKDALRVIFLRQTNKKR